MNDNCFAKFTKVFPHQNLVLYAMYMVYNDNFTSPPDCSTAPMIFWILSTSEAGPAMSDVPVSAIAWHLEHMLVVPTDTLNRI